MHELFELPRNTINADKEDSFYQRYHRPCKDTHDLEEEVKIDNRMTEDNSDIEDEVNQELQRMYKISKKNIDKDEKL